MWHIQQNIIDCNYWKPCLLRVLDIRTQLRFSDSQQKWTCWETGAAFVLKWRAGRWEIPCVVFFFHPSVSVALGSPLLLCFVSHIPTCSTASDSSAVKINPLLWSSSIFQYLFEISKETVREDWQNVFYLLVDWWEFVHSRGGRETWWRWLGHSFQRGVEGINKSTENLKVLLMTYLFTDLSLPFPLYSTVGQRGWPRKLAVASFNERSQLRMGLFSEEDSTPGRSEPPPGTCIRVSNSHHSMEPSPRGLVYTVLTGLCPNLTTSAAGRVSCLGIPFIAIPPHGGLTPEHHPDSTDDNAATSRGELLKSGHLVRVWRW